MRETLQFELLSLDLQQLSDLCEAQGEPRYRGSQIFHALYRQRVASLDEMSTLPRRFRERLAAEGYRVGAVEIARRYESVDGTVRYLMRLGDGQTVETVWMPEGDGGEEGEHVAEPGRGVPGERSRATLCISSQVGCAVNCRFCLTAQLGLLRNLSAGEIAGQVLTALSDHEVDVERDRINLVFMGQGEPFLNYENFIKAVRLLVEGAGIAESRMTVSTSGIVPRLAEFAREPIRPRLAISLNGAEDAVRTSIMPVNGKWNLERLLAAAREFPLRPRERLTFEYVLLSGVNDSDEDARRLIQLLRGLRAKVNLIAFNSGPDLPFATPSQERVLSFQQLLTAAGVPAFIRRPRGRDIYAACGQLKRMAETASVVKTDEQTTA